MTEEIELYTVQRMGFFGFALGFVLYFVIGFTFHFLPVLQIFLPVYAFPWNYIMPFLYPFILGTIFFFIPYKKSKF